MSKLGKSNSRQNKWVIDGDVAIGEDSNGNKFLIDLEDLPKVEKYCWRVHKTGYVVANSKDGTNTTIWIHRVIMNPKDYELVDHEDWNKLDNRKSNLRVCTKSENNVNIKRKSNNTSGYTGVKQAPNGKWKSQISFKNNRIHLGTFETIEEAIIARKRAEEIIHKDFNGELNRQDFIKIFKEKE